MIWLNPHFRAALSVLAYAEGEVELWERLTPCLTSLSHLSHEGPETGTAVAEAFRHYCLAILPEEHPCLQSMTGMLLALLGMQTLHLKQHSQDFTGRIWPEMGSILGQIVSEFKWKLEVNVDNDDALFDAEFVFLSILVLFSMVLTTANRGTLRVDLLPDSKIRIRVFADGQVKNPFLEKSEKQIKALFANVGYELVSSKSIAGVTWRMGISSESHVGNEQLNGILVGEGNVFLSMMLKNWLKPLAHHIVCLGDGASILQQLHHSEFDCLVLSDNMAGISGRDSVRLIRMLEATRMGTPIRIVLLSQPDRPISVDEFIQIPIYDWDALRAAVSVPPQLGTTPLSSTPLYSQ